MNDENNHRSSPCIQLDFTLISTMFYRKLYSIIQNFIYIFNTFLSSFFLFCAMMVDDFGSHVWELYLSAVFKFNLNFLLYDAVI